MPLDLEERERFRFYRISKGEKERVAEVLKRVLYGRGETALAVLYGSFLKDYPFRDIDVAVYVVGEGLDPLDYELSLEAELSEKLGYNTDVKVLNDAPPWFVKKALREGVILIEKIPLLNEKLYLKAVDEEALAEHIEP
ncbi:MAG: nucleotidyltransferase domain-containing protein [Thermoproteota archaeon]